MSQAFPVSLTEHGFAIVVKIRKAFTLLAAANSRGVVTTMA